MCRAFNSCKKARRSHGKVTAFQVLSMVLLVLLSAVLPAWAAEPSTATADRTTVLLVVGAPGAPEFGSNFVQQATLWEAACNQAGCRRVTIGLDPAGVTNDFDTLKQTLAVEPREGVGQLWIVFIGHGTFDGKEARFNLRGPDVSATDLALWLKPFHRLLAVIDTSSSSAPFLNKLSGANRVIMTATRSGNELNYARFGQYLAEAITNPDADLDKDGQVSLLEAFLTAARKTAEFYKVEGRLLTEHALIDDNGDALGTPPDWFRGLRATRRPKDSAALDGLLAQQIYLVPSAADKALPPEQRAQRDALERAVLLHREKKSQMKEDDYYTQLEKLLLDLARVATVSTAGTSSSTSP
jgi:hypothetical protein